MAVPYPSLRLLLHNIEAMDTTHQANAEEETREIDISPSLSDLPNSVDPTVSVRKLDKTEPILALLSYDEHGASRVKRSTNEDDLAFV